jgi:hypothetical protein
MLTNKKNKIVLSPGKIIIASSPETGDRGFEKGVELCYVLQRT